MTKYCILLFICFIATGFATAQETLPRISVTNYSGKIIVNWKNAYKVPVTNISIQRSYDSLKNYTTIGSVLNPQSEENGYSDNEPPYNKMYYRAFIAFEGGAYIISPAVRPVKAINTDTAVVRTDTAVFPWQFDPRTDSTFNPPPPTPPSPIVKNQVVYPSQRIYTAKDNSIVIHLPDAAMKKYSAKFFNEARKQIFELFSLKDDYLIIEKVNFGRAGWYFFELYDDGKLIEKNKFLVPKDGRITND